MPSALFCQDISPPLSESDKRIVLELLYKLVAQEARLQLLTDTRVKEEALRTQEKINWERALEIEKSATALAEREKDLQKERADLYQQLYNTVTKKTGFWCKVKKVFSLGTAKCK